MTRHRDIEALLDLWLADGPTEVPDRVFDETVDRIDRQSQQPAWRVGLRHRGIRPRVWFGAAVAAILFVAVVGLNLLERPPAISGPPATASPAPSRISSPTPSTAPSLGPKFSIRVGSDTFGSSTVIAELYAQALEDSGYPVTRVPAYASMAERLAAFDSGRIDLMPEHTGWRLGHDATATIGSDPTSNGYTLQNIYDSSGGLAFDLSVTPGADTTVGVMRKDTTDLLSLTRLSDLAAVQDQLTWGLPADCDANRLCKGALETYGIAYPPAHRVTVEACGQSTAQTLQDRAVDVAWMCATQGAIAQLGLVVLADDKAIQPPGGVQPIVRTDYLARYAVAADRNAFLFVLDGVSAQLTTDELTKIGVKIDVEHQPLADVARQWLTDQGLPRAGGGNTTP